MIGYTEGEKKGGPLSAGPPGLAIYMAGDATPSVTDGRPQEHLRLPVGCLGLDRGGVSLRRGTARVVCLALLSPAVPGAG